MIEKNRHKDAIARVDFFILQVLGLSLGRNLYQICFRDGVIQHRET
jgi:hypothetical protein